MARQGRIVAELGRPETAEETAARKAAASARHRANQTMLNLVLALAASLGIVLILVLVVVRPDPPQAEPVDYAAVADQAQTGVNVPLITPVLPPGWTANRAELEPEADETATWYIGFITPGNQFVALEQGINQSGGWFADLIGTAASTGTTTIDGVEWDVYDRREAEDPGNFAYSLATTIGDQRFLLHGTAGDADFAALATAVAADLADAPEPDTE